MNLNTAGNDRASNRRTGLDGTTKGDEPALFMIVCDETPVWRVPREARSTLTPSNVKKRSAILDLRLTNHVCRLTYCI